VDLETARGTLSRPTKGRTTNRRRQHGNVIESQRQWVWRDSLAEVQDMSEQARARLLKLFKERAFSFGQFTLASGKESTYYVNSKKAIFNGEVVALLGDALWELTRDLDIQALGGLEVGAIPMAAAAAYRYHQEHRPLEGFFVRKEAKDHGSRDRIEGVLRPGFRVAVVDDVFTQGASVLQAALEVERAGAIVAAVICIVDRLEGARERLATRYTYRSIFTIRDFGVDDPAEPPPSRP
jgi:orotate phosphoribosyltransferase